MEQSPITAPFTLNYNTPLPAPKPRVWTVLVNGVIVLFSMLAVSFAFVICLALYVHVFLKGHSSLEEILYKPPVYFGLGFIIQFLILGAAIIPALLSPQPWRQRLYLQPPVVSVLTILLAGVGCLAVGTAVGVVTALLNIESEPALRMTTVIAESNILEWIIGFVLVCVAAPIFEELLCRGYIQSRLIERWGPAAGIAITSLIFGLMHMDLVHSPQAMILGVALGFIAWRSGSTIPAIIAHAINNTAAYFIAGNDSWLLLALMSPFLLTGLLGGTWLLLKSPRPNRAFPVIQ